MICIKIADMTPRKLFRSSTMIPIR